MKRLWAGFVVALRTAAVTSLVGFALGGAYAVVVVTITLVAEPSASLELAMCFVLLYVGGIAGAMGCAAGFILGGISGAASGLVTGVLTAVAYFPLTGDKVQRFRESVTVIGVAITAAITYLLAPQAVGVLAPAWVDEDGTGTLVVYALLPALIAGSGAWWVSHRVARWYETESREPLPRAVE